MESTVKLVPLQSEDRNQFILDNQEAFNYGAMVEFGLRDDHMEEDGQIISRHVIEESLDAPGAIAYRIICDNQIVGGMILSIDETTRHGELEILFIAPSFHSKGIGKKAWFEVEKMYPEILCWTTFTPYFETRNIHFYVNSLGFHIVEFFHKGHKDPTGKFAPENDENDMMLKFVKTV